MCLASNLQRLLASFCRSLVMLDSFAGSIPRLGDLIFLTSSRSSHGPDSPFSGVRSAWTGIPYAQWTAYYCADSELKCHLVAVLWSSRQNEINGQSWGICQVFQSLKTRCHCATCGRTPGNLSIVRLTCQLNPKLNVKVGKYSAYRHTKW